MNPFVGGMVDSAATPIYPLETIDPATSTKSNNGAKTVYNKTENSSTRMMHTSGK